MTDTVDDLAKARVVLCEAIDACVPDIKSRAAIYAAAHAFAKALARSGTAGNLQGGHAVTLRGVADHTPVRR